MVGSDRPKVFCIGFHKTGTTSLAEALGALGYTVTGPNGVNDPDISVKVHAMAEALVPEFDAFQDNPWPILYRFLDQKYPGSRFILTMRDPDSWLRSQLNHFGEQVTPMREWIYGVGSPVGNEAIYLERFNAHNAEVLDHFRDRPDALLVLNLGEGDGWEKLCAFLSEEVPNRPFPHVNKASDRVQRGLSGKLRRLLRRVGVTSDR